MQKGFVLTERLFKTEEGKIVREGDPDAAYVYRGAGQKISFEEAAELGLVDGEEAAATESEEGKYEGKLLKDCTDEDLVDHFLDTLEEIHDRDLDEEQLAEKARERVPGWFAAEADAAGDSGEGSEETVDLSELTRDQLNEKAAELGIESPDRIKGGKPKVIEAIEAKLAEADAAGDSGEGSEE